MAAGDETSGPEDLVASSSDDNRARCLEESSSEDSDAEEEDALEENAAEVAAVLVTEVRAERGSDARRTRAVCLSFCLAHCVLKMFWTMCWGAVQVEGEGGGKPPPVAEGLTPFLSTRMDG